MNPKAKNLKKGKIAFLHVIGKEKVTITDETHVVGFGDAATLKKPMLRKYFGNIAFNFAYLEQARSFFESILGKDFDPYYLHVYIPNTPKTGPILFLYDFQIMFQKKQKTLFFAVAPLKVEDN